MFIREDETASGGGWSGVGRYSLQFKAYNISVEQEAAEILQNEGRPTAEFLLSDVDSLEVQEFKLREYRRRFFSARTVAKVYQAQLRNEYEEMRKKMRTEESVAENTVGSVVPGPGMKVSSHFTDRDGKLITSYNRNISRTTVEFSMAFLRMVHVDRVFDICTDELHIFLDVAHARGVYLSKANMHSSLIAGHWESINLWGSIENLSIMQKDKFSHVLLFDGNLEELGEFSLANFLVDTGLLSNITYLRESLDNLELVYRCVMGEVYAGITSAAKDFLRNNFRVLSTRSFAFVRSVFEAAFVRFQMELRSRDVSTGAAPLNTQNLVFDFFQQCFDFPLELFSRDEEDIYNNRVVARQLASKQLGTRKLSVNAPTPKVPLVRKGHQGMGCSRGPSIVHLAHSLGIATLGGRAIKACSLGSACRFEHLSLPLLDAKRTQVVTFIKDSSAQFLRMK